MTEFEELSKDVFFVLDSENLDTVKTKLYGFALSDAGCIIQDGGNMTNVPGGGYLCMGKF